MATNDELKEYIEQLLTNYDPNIDLSPDSSAQEFVIEPLIALYGDDPLDTPFEKFIRNRVAENYTQLEKEGGSPLSELLLGPARVIFAPLSRQIAQLRDRQRADTLTVHTEESLTAKLSNLFLEINDGDRAVGVVRIYYDSPRYVEATTDRIFSTPGGLTFFPNGDQSITAANMLYNREGAYYYFDVQAIAQNPGSAYNVSAGSITGASGFPGYVRVTNKYSFTQGANEETIEEFWYRAASYPTEVSLNTHRGISATLSEAFPSIADIALVGYGDEDMVRDMLTGGGYGSPVATAFGSISTISLVEDGDYDLESNLIYVSSIDFTTYLGPVGDVSGRGAIDLVWTDIDGDLQFDTFDVLEVIDINTVKIDEQIDVSAIAAPAIYALSLRNKSISISSIPGGFADPTVSPPVEQPDQVHVGGATDIYIKDPDPTNATVDLALISDETYVASYERIVLTAAADYVDIYDAEATEVHSATGNHALINNALYGNNVVRLTDINWTTGPLPTALKENSVIHIASGTHAGYYRIGSVDASGFFAGYIEVTVTDLDGSAITPFAVGITATPYEIYDYVGDMKPGYVLNLTSGEPGTYKIIDYLAGGISAAFSLPVLRLITDYTFSASSVDNAGKIYDDVELDLAEPKNVRIQDSDLSGAFGTSKFTSTGGTNFVSYGVVADDTLRVLTGPASGDYTVVSVGGAGNTVITVQETIPAIVTAQQFIVFDALDSPELPLLKMNEVSLLDSNLSPIGVEIPCGDPLAFRSGEFTNFGNGVLEETYRAIVGIFSESPAATYTIFGEELRLQITYPNGITLDDTLTFATANPVPIASAAAEINNNFGDDYAVVITVGSQEYLGLRPLGNVNIRVHTPAGTNAAIKLGIAGKYSNRVEFANTFTESLSTTRDYLYLVEGTNAPRMEPFIGSSGGDTIVCPTTTNFWPEGFAHAVVGMPSLGRVRTYFKDPTYFYFDSDSTTTFEHDSVDKECMIYRHEEATLLPAYPTTTKPTLDTPTASTTAADADATFMSDLIQDASSDRIAPGETLPGDFVDISYRTCWFDQEFQLNGAGSTAFAAAGEWLRMSVGDSQVQTVTFTADMPPQDVADAINEVFPDIAEIVEDGGNYWLTLTSQEEISNVAYSAGVNGELNDFIPTTNDNHSTNYGEYQISSVDSETSLTVDSALSVEETLGTGPGPLPAALIPDVQYRVFRKAAYHISPTEMEENTDGGFYYADFDMVSNGVGDEFNLPADLYGEGSNYVCKGYRLNADSEALSFSPNEELRLVMTNSFYEPGVEIRPSKATVIAGSNIELEYDYSALVDAVNAFVTSDSERVLVSSPLCKHMLPHYVGANISYRGGPTESAAKDAVEDIIENVFSGQTLEVHDVVAALANKGATYVQMPVQLYVMYQDINRSMWLKIVENTDTLDELACFFAALDRLTLTRLT